MDRYGIATRTLNIKPDMQDATADELSVAMSSVLDQSLQMIQIQVNNLPNAQNPVLLSHSLTRIGSHLLLSVLFRAQKL